MSNISTLPPQQPPLPNFQPLNPTPYKRASALLEMSPTLTEAHDDPTSPEKLTTCSFNKTGTQASHPTVSAFRTPLLHAPTLQYNPMSSPEIPAIITVHVQTIITQLPAHYQLAAKIIAPFSTMTWNTSRILPRTQRIPLRPQLYHLGTYQSSVLVTVEMDALSLT